MSINPKTDKLPLVSVVMAYYDDYEYINEALNSCVNQTYLNIEIVIIDDCSPKPLKIEDLTIDINKYPITILRNNENRGPGYSRNKGIKVAKGDFIGFLDADDIWKPEILEKQIQVFLSDPQAVWVYTDGFFLTEFGKMNKSNSAYQGFGKSGFPVGRQVHNYHLQGYNFLTFSSNTIKKSALLEVGMFNECLTVSEDWEMFVRLAEKYPVHAINEPLMYYRFKANGRHYEGSDDFVKTNIEILKQLYQRQGLPVDGSSQFKKAVAKIYLQGGLQKLKYRSTSQAKALLFHPACAPLKFQPQVILAKCACFLPKVVLKLAYRVYYKM